MRVPNNLLATGKHESPKPWTGRFPEFFEDQGQNDPVRLGLSSGQRRSTSVAMQPLASDAAIYGSLADMIYRLRRKDCCTWEHSRRVSTYSVAIGLQMGLSQQAIGDLEVGGRLHDIGKLMVPTYLLRKTGALSAAQYRTVSAHAANGARLLERFFPASSTVVKIARWHHHRIDGRGVNDGISGANIPLAARIVAVADSYDAMTSTRPYRPMMPASAAWRELESNVAGQFDADCVAAFERAIHPDALDVSHFHMAA